LPDNQDGLKQRELRVEVFKRTASEIIPEVVVAVEVVVVEAVEAVDVEVVI